MANDKHMFQTYIANYSYATDDGTLRNAAKMITAQTAEQARASIIQTLSSKHKYFRLTKLSTTQNDNNQPQL